MAGISTDTTGSADYIRRSVGVWRRAPIFVTMSGLFTGCRYNCMYGKLFQETLITLAMPSAGGEILIRRTATMKERIVMVNLLKSVRLATLLGALSGVLILAGCATRTEGLAELPQASGDAQNSTRYRIAPLDNVQIFVWRNPEVSTSVPVRPDGLLSAPLLEEVPAAGKTPAELARDLEAELSTYLRDPLVTVIVDNFVGTFRENIQVLGEAAQPQAMLYRDSMTVFDVLVATGGLTEFADGNNSMLVRRVDGELVKYRLRLNDLTQEGDVTANVDMRPGDVVIIPEAWF